MELKIKVQIKHVYGNETIYPFCEKAKIFAQMLNQRTLTRHDIQHIKQLGYAVEVVRAPVTL